MNAPEQLTLTLKAPWQMTLAEFGNTYKPVRCFQQYTTEHRAKRAASFRLGPAQRERVGEYCYLHPLRPDVAYPSPSQARWITHWNLVKQALAQELPVPAEVRREYPTLLQESAS